MRLLIIILLLLLCESAFSRSPAVTMVPDDTSYRIRNDGRTTGGGDCIFCVGNSGFAGAPITGWGYQPFGGYNPWWWDYGRMRWPYNWHSPGLVNNWQAYPGPGTAVAAKPNVYISGSEGTYFDIQMDFKGQNNLLLAAPSLEEGWNGILLKDGMIQVGEGKYGFLYYDYKTDIDTMQFNRGFCGSKEMIIQTMGSYLDEAGFKQEEIIDFYEHWPEKLHEAKEYCVYPQNNKNLGSQVKLKIRPKEHHLVRLNFVVVLKKGKYKNAKARPYKLDPKYISKGSDELFEIREWGVIFLTEN